MKLQALYNTVKQTQLPALQNSMAEFNAEFELVSKKSVFIRWLHWNFPRSRLNQLAKTLTAEMAAEQAKAPRSPRSLISSYQQLPFSLAATQKVTQKRQSLSKRAISSSTVKFLGEHYDDIHPKVLAKVANLKNDPGLAEARKKLGIPQIGKPLHTAGLIRDRQYGYAYTKKGTTQTASYKHWHIAAIHNKTNQLISAEGLVLTPGWYMYVVTLDNQLRYLPCDDKAKDGLLYTQFRCHSQLAEGKNVYGAGTFYLNEQGRMAQITNASGHYRPEQKYLIYTVNLLEKMGIATQNIRVDAEVIQRNESTAWKKIRHFSGVFAQAVRAGFSEQPSTIEERPPLPPHLTNRMGY